MRLLIITPEIHRLGGVSNHYLGLSKHWTFDVSYLFYGKRTNKTPTWLVLLLYPFDYIRFIYLLMTSHYDAVLINPSLRKVQLIRDGLFLLIAKIFRKNVITFIHGFDVQLVEKFVKNKGLFQWCYNKSLFIYTLYSGFKKQLEDAGITCPILLTTTKVSNELIEDNSVQPRTSIHNILFVARINKEKGIFTTLEAFRELKSKYPKLHLTICGDGPALNDAKKYVENYLLTDVEFTGNVAGNKLRDHYQKGDIYILPTHGEGMATSVLEAMAFGIPVITRPVGGVVDFWQNGKMGYLLPSLNSKDYAIHIEYLINNPEVVQSISHFNHTYAKEHFLASKVAKKIEEDIQNHLLG